MEGMYYTVYQTTNLVSGKVYIGIHCTENPNDSYLGSGSHLRRAIRKYGKSSFRKEVLFVYDNPAEMAAKEAELVTLDFAARQDTYNLVPGGYQTVVWYSARQNITPEQFRLRSVRGNEVYSALLKTSEYHREVQRLNGERFCAYLHSRGLVKKAPFTGLKHSEETLQKMRSARKGRCGGSANPSFGTFWVCKAGTPKKITASELDSYLELGWKRGRK